jgi:hypothetical protein
MILHTETEAALLGFSDAASHLELAAQSIVKSVGRSPKSVVPDDIFEVIERLDTLKRKRRRKESR